MTMVRDYETGRFVRVVPIVASPVPPEDRPALGAALGIRLVEVSCDDGRGPCWVPDTKPERTGYVRLKRDGKRRLAHRLALSLVGRTVPAGYQADHLCRNTACCRPRHLDIVTPRTNTLRSTGASAVASVTGICKAGLHLLTPDNLVPAKLRLGARVCLACRRAYEAGYRSANRERDRDRQRARSADPRQRAAHAQRQRRYLDRKRGMS